MAAAAPAAGGAGRAAVVAFYPAAVELAHRAVVLRKFVQALGASGLGADPHPDQGQSYILVDFKTRATRRQLEVFVSDFARQLSGTEAEPHPDFVGPLVVLGDEDPAPELRRLAAPRYTFRELEQAAELLETNLKQVASVGRVRKLGNVPEVIYLLFSIPNLEGFNLPPELVLDAIATRNAIIPGGTLRAEGQNFPVQLTGTFTNEADLPDTIVGMTQEGPTGLPVYLRDLFEVRRGYADPIPYKVDVLHRPAAGQPLAQERAVLVAVEMKEGNIIGQFDQQVRHVLARLQPRLPEGMAVVTLSDQPTAVGERVGHFMECFLEAVIVVVLVALLLMEWRAALVVATAIPLTVALTLGGMRLLDAPLHQISIAALIIALGMLVDDPVVATDGINRALARGEPRDRAAWLGPYGLRRPILFGTVINIVAFLPLLLLPGDKGAFIAGLPLVVTLALISSRLVSLTFVPLLGYYWLRGQKGLEAGGEARRGWGLHHVDGLLIRLLPHYRRLLQAALEQPWRAVGLAYGLLALSFGLTPWFGRQFFPPAERNQLLIDLELPASASLAQTREVCAQVAAVLRRHPTVASAALFSGGTAPRFYYNVTPREPAPYLAQALVNTVRARDVPPLLVQLRQELDREVVGARCLVKQLEQGPPVEAPLQVRLTGDDYDALRGWADQVAAVLRAAGGYQVDDDLGRRLPTLEIAIDQHRANLLEINNARVGRLAQAAFAGLKVTELREGDHLVPVVVRLRAEERAEADRLRTLHIRSLRDRLVPLDNFAQLKVQPEFATLAHFNHRRAVTVQGYSAVGELPSQVLARARPALARLALPPGYDLALAGEEKELKTSQSEMAQVMEVSLALITLALVLQFHSVVKPLVVLLTVPLGLIGAFVGLAVTGAALGFMALLGIVSLGGVVVSHIIVLSDFIEEARAEGMELRTALVQAGLVRLRAVLVTVLATVGGLIPLALTGGELWHPLTAVHIFGLLFATLLTLVLLPVLYYLFCARLKWMV